MDFHGGTVDRNAPANAGHVGSISGLGSFHVAPARARAPHQEKPQPREARARQEE